MARARRSASRVVMSSTYRLGADLEYGRDGNATWAALEGLVGELEGGHAVAFGSGLAACAAVLDAVPAGGAVVAPRSAYHGFTDQLRAREAVARLTVRWVDIGDAQAVADAAPGAAMVWLETPSNPLIAVADIAAAAAARDSGSLLVVDSTFATPILQRPLEHGADVVVHSATKYIGGHADLLLGLAICREQPAAHALWGVRHREGAIPGSLEAFLALRGAPHARRAARARPGQRRGAGPAAPGASCRHAGPLSRACRTTPATRWRRGRWTATGRCCRSRQQATRPWRTRCATASG